MDFENEQEILRQFFKKIPNKLLSAEEEKALAKRIKEGDKEALKTLVQANLRFVINIARQYMNFGLPLSELISAGNLGLMEAAKRFNPDKNVKFISYAVWWIRQAITQAISYQTGAVRIPLRQTHRINVVNYAYNKLLKELGREPTYLEISEYINKEKAIKDFKKQKNTEPTEKELKKYKPFITEEEVRNYLQISRTFLSLDTPVEEDSDILFVDLLFEENTNMIEEEITKNILEEKMQEMMKKLPEKERKVLELKYGLNGNEPHTLHEIGRALKLSKERVRQIEVKAIKQLRRIAFKEHFKDFLL